MNIHIASNATATRGGQRRQLVLAAAGAALALTVAASIGAWQIAGHGGRAGTTTATTSASGSTTIVSREGAPSMGGVAEQLKEQRERAATVAEDSPRPMGGVAEQMKEQQELASVQTVTRGDAAGIRGDMGVTYYLVGSEAQAAALRQESLDALRDARDSGTVLPDHFRHPLITIVGSAAQEEQVRQAVKDEAQWRHDMGLPGVRVVDLRAG